MSLMHLLVPWSRLRIHVSFRRIPVVVSRHDKLGLSFLVPRVGESPVRLRE